ncbi:MAG TPA: hypothetical protein VMA75_04060 [Candidatus Paceibacterota bacterium]|nr:hypothetical protein [Candidatus Paceibacterota bacterium]
MKKYLIYIAIGFITGLVVIIGSGMLTGNVGIPGFDALSHFLPSIHSMETPFVLWYSLFIGFIITLLYWIILSIKKMKITPLILLGSFLCFSVGVFLVYLIYAMLIAIAFANWKGSSFL